MRLAILSLLLTLAACAAGQRAYAQEPKVRGQGPGYYFARVEVIEGDTIQVIDMMPAYKFRRPIDQKRYAKLIRNVKIVYPIAKEAKNRLAKMEEYMLTLPSDKERKQYIKRMEREIKQEYEPILRKMTFSQGKILIKLIDRETSHTSYALVKELRGGFSAFFYQGIARLFGANLKDGYDKTGDDKMIEQVIILYEAGII